MTDEDGRKTGMLEGDGRKAGDIDRDGRRWRNDEIRLKKVEERQGGNGGKRRETKE